MNECVKGWNEVMNEGCVLLTSTIERTFVGLYSISVNAHPPIPRPTPST